jgi:cell division septal protein FtsQ
MVKRIRKKHCAKKKKCVFENNIIFGIIVFFSFSIGTFYFLFFHPYFQINSIRIDNSFTIDKEELSHYFNEITRQNVLAFSSKSIIPLSSKKMRSKVLSQTSVIKDIEIRKVFPSQLSINLIERAPVAIFCKSNQKEKCYYIDDEGIIFQKTTNKEKLTIVKESNFLVGDRLIEAEDLEKLFYIRNELQKENLSTNYFDLSKENSIEVFLKEGWSILFSKNNHSQELKNLHLVLEKFSLKEKNKIKYIDLRFGDRVYYK